MKSSERFVVELQLHLGEAQLRAEHLVSASEEDILSDNAVKPAQAQTGELEIETAGPKVFQQRRFYKPRQPDLIEIKDESQQGQDHQPDGDAETAKINPAQTPEPAFVAWRHFPGAPAGG